MFRYNKAQAWGIDLMIGLIIFTVSIVMFYFYALNVPNEATESLGGLFYDGEIITNTLLSAGYPRDWDSDSANADKIGIVDDGKINETKLEEFYNLAFTETDYTGTKILFNTRYDYYFFLGDVITIPGVGNVDGIGKPGADRTNINDDAENLIKITRFMVYKEKPITAYVYIWEE